jgi:hypothetical protein
MLLRRVFAQRSGEPFVQKEIEWPERAKPRRTGIFYDRPSRYNPAGRTLL